MLFNLFLEFSQIKTILGKNVRKRELIMQKQKIRWKKLKESSHLYKMDKFQKIEKKSLQLLILPHCVLEQFTFSIHCEIDSSRPIMFVVKGIFLELAQWVNTFLKWHSYLTNYLISQDVYENVILYQVTSQFKNCAVFQL